MASKKSARYQNVDLPIELIRAVRNKVTEPNSLYTSMANFVKAAIREKLAREQTLYHRKRTKTMRKQTATQTS